jgi:hypothetical protein
VELLKNPNPTHSTHTERLLSHSYSIVFNISMPNVNNQMIAAINARNNQHSSNKNNNMLDNTVEEVIVLNPEHAAALKETQNFTRQLQCIRGHNRRISQMIEWIRTHYPSSFATMCRPLTAAEMDQEDTFYQATHDFVYEKLEPTLIEAFI